MIRFVFKYEWKKLWVDRIAPLTIIILTVLTIAACLNGKAFVEYQLQQIEKIIEDKSRLEDSVKREISGYRNHGGVVSFDAPHNPSLFYGSFKTVTTKNPSLLAVLNMGQADIYPYYSVSTALDKRKLVQNDEIRNPLNLMIGGLDMTFVIIFVLPLLIMVLSYDLYSGEAEKKTILMVKAQGIKLKYYIFYKLAFRFLFFTSCFIFVLSSMILIVNAQIIFSWEYYQYLILAIAYFLFWFSLALLVNTLGESSVANGVILLSFWVFFTMLMPYAISYVSSQKYPVPSREVQLIEQRYAQKQVDRTEALERVLIKNPDFNKFKEDTTVHLIFEANHGYVKLVAYQQELLERTGHYESSVLEALENQETYSQKWRFLSPPLILHASMGRLAGNSTLQYLQYLSDINQNHIEWRNFMAPKVFRKELLTLQDIEKLPVFLWKDMHPYRWNLLLNDFLFLSGTSLLAFLMGMRRFSKF